MESVKEEAILLKNQLQAERLRHQKMRERNTVVRNLPRAKTTAETEKERILRNQMELLQSQLCDANSMVISFEKTLDELRNEKEPLQDSAITEIARQSHGKSTAQTENEIILRNQIESLQKQLSDANNTIRNLESTLDELRNESKSLKDTGITQVAQQCHGGSTAETENERMLRNQIELLQSQLSDANNMVRSLERTVDDLINQNKLLQDTDITEVAQQIHETSVAATGEENMLRNENESLQKQLNDINSIIKNLENTVVELRKETESLPNKLNDSNTMVQELENRVKKLTDENNVLKSMQIKDGVSTPVDQIPVVTIMETVEPNIEIVMNKLKTENESLRTRLENTRKSVHKTSDNESEYEKLIAEQKTENELLHKKIEDARMKQHRMSHEDPGTTKIINQMNQVKEMLRKQIEDLKKTQARPSSVETSNDKAFEQLMKENEAVREKFENARKVIEVSSETHELIEREDVIQLIIDNEILRKQLEDPRKMAKSSQEQVLVDETDFTKITDQLKEENDFFKNRLESLTDITSGSAKEVVKYSEKPVEIFKADMDSEKTNNELRNLNESLQNELKDANIVKRELEEQVRRLKDEKQVPILQLQHEKSSEKDMSQLMEQNELLKEQLLDATTKIEDLTMNVTKLEDEIQRIQSTQISDLPSGVEEHAQEFQRLEAELQALRDENRRLQRDNEKLTLEVESLTEENIPSEVSLWKTEEKQLESVVDEQKRRITTLLSKMGRKEHPEEVVACTRERGHLLDTIRQLTKEVKEAYEEKEEMDERLEAELKALRDENRRLQRYNKKLTLEVQSFTEEKIPSEVSLWKNEEKQLESAVNEQKRLITTLLLKIGGNEHPEEVAAWTL